jgi:hypothetical protein
MWLPTFGSANAFQKQASHLSQFDRINYFAPWIPSAPDLRLQPADGTYFVYGDTNPRTVRVVYDYAHNITFYEQGCCSTREFVAAYASPPPDAVANHDLATLVTFRGIHLAMSPGDVQRVYGPARLKPIPQRPGVLVLAYTAPCQFRNFFFINDRLVLIQFAAGCLKVEGMRLRSVANLDRQADGKHHCCTGLVLRRLCTTRLCATHHAPGEGGLVLSGLGHGDLVLRAPHNSRVRMPR